MRHCAVIAYVLTHSWSSTSIVWLPRFGKGSESRIWNGSLFSNAFNIDFAWVSIWCHRLNVGKMHLISETNVAFPANLGWGASQMLKKFVKLASWKLWLITWKLLFQNRMRISLRKSLQESYSIFRYMSGSKALATLYGNGVIPEIQELKRRSSIMPTHRKVNITFR